MPSFGTESLARLSTCDERLQKVLKELIKYFDIKILEGHRGKELQDKAFAEGKSKLKFPQSKHNSNPSKAVDIVPWPLDWKDRERFFYMAGVAIGIGASMGIKLRWGGCWAMDNNFKANKFDDLPHLEVID